MFTREVPKQTYCFPALFCNRVPTLMYFMIMVITASEFVEMSHILLVFYLLGLTSAGPEVDQGVRYANRCETCKILATELQQRLVETGKSSDIMEIGYSMDDVKPKKRTEYRRSELRLLESLENICDRILEYNLHKERTDSTRFAKGMSQTFKTLHGLVDKGVKVELGIPYELWNKPPVEVTEMKTQCENLLEEYEDVISDWYFNMQDKKSLLSHLCEDVVLSQDDRKCLTEAIEGNGSTDNQLQNGNVNGSGDKFRRNNEDL